jgi:TolB-like protein/tetratricopeptide (TPR) repeat protein
MSERMVVFGPFVLNTDNGTLFRDGALVAIGQKSAALLGALATHPGQVLTKTELMDAAWSGITVEESNLSVQIGALRKLLGTAPGGGEWIATVPRVGYRFIGQVGAPSKPEARPESVLPSLAVLPFHNMSGDPEQDYFTDGIVEDMITALSRFRSFAVIARNSTFVYKGKAVDVRQIAKDLGARYLLEGSVRRVGKRLRITAQLIEGASGTHLWADHFDGTVEDIFDVQDRITASTIGLVEPQMRRAEIERSRRKRPDSLDAYDIYLHALARMDGADDASSAEAYTLAMRAVTLEPNHGPFLVVAVWALTRRVVMGWSSLTDDDRTAALNLVRRALAVADGDPAVLAQCAATLIGIGHDYQRGMNIIANAVAANPNHMVVLTVASIAELHCGDLEKSLAFSRRAILMSPGAPTAYIAMTAIAHANMVLGSYEEALKTAARSLAANPSFPPTLWMLIAANAQLGRIGEARGWLTELNKLAPSMTIADIVAGQPAFDSSRMAAILDGLRRAGLEEG